MRISQCRNKGDKKIDESDARQLEIKRLLKAENPMTEGEREASKLIEAIVLHQIKCTYFF